MHACVRVCACMSACGVHVSMIIRNIMQDEYLYHNYVLQCSLFAGRHPRPADYWQESDTNGRIERLK